MFQPVDLATVTGGTTVKEYAQGLVKEYGPELGHRAAVTTGSLAAGVAAFGATSIKLHGQFFIPPARGWRTWVPYGAYIAASSVVATALNRVVP